MPRPKPRPMLDGVVVEQRPALGGRALVATRAFEAGDIVLLEPPLLHWTAYSDDIPNLSAYLNAVAAAPPRVWTALDDFARPALDEHSSSLRVQARADDARDWLVTRGKNVPPGWTLDYVHGLCLVADTNSHVFLGGDDSTMQEVLPTDLKPHPAALFVLGSKAAHSCRPNTLYTSRDGVLRYIATRPIAAGEAVTFSYINLHGLPRKMRRSQLISEKHFHCCCERCVGVDDCRGLRCRSCGGVAMHTEIGDTWTCTACAVPLVDAMLADALRV